MTGRRVVPLMPHAYPPVNIRAYGVPIAKGSMQAAVGRDGKPYVRADNPDALRRWTADVKGAAELAMLGRDPFPIHEALTVALTFLVPRPKSYSVRVRLPYTRPDIDKLARAILDALTGPVFGDDGAVSTLMTRKRFAPPSHTPGVLIRVQLDRL